MIIVLKYMQGTKNKSVFVLLMIENVSLGSVPVNAIYPSVYRYCFQLSYARILIICSIAKLIPQLDHHEFVQDLVYIWRACKRKVITWGFTVENGSSHQRRITLSTSTD